MRQNVWVRALDYMIESCWLLALVTVPIFFDTMTVRIFEPDKIALFRNIVLVMVLAVLVRAVVAAPAAMARASSAGDATRGRPWWRREIARRPLVVPVIIFALIYSVATATSVLPGISFWGSYDRMQGLYTWLSYMTFFAILAYSIRNWAQIERIVSAFVFTSVPVALYGIVQHLQLDPVQWGADTSIRVASTLGNSIFLGAYLLMCMPFTAYRLWRAVERLRATEPAPEPVAPRAGGRRPRPRPKDTIEINITGVPPIVSVVGYGLILMLSYAALYFSGSRGPYYGFIVAVVVMGFLLTFKLNNPWPAISSLVLAVVLYEVLSVINALDAVIALVLLLVFVAAAVAVLVVPRAAQVASPAIAGVALIVAIFIFPQAVNVVSPAVTSGAADTTHLTDLGINGTSEVRTFIWQGSMGLIKARPILGWGPETMIYVYAPYYPSGLGHIERANAAPDRNHDEWLDFLVFSGVLGLAAWLGILGTFAWMGLSVLRRATSRRVAVFTAAAGAIVVGHLAEATVGIDIVSTLMLLWTVFAVVTAMYARPELIGQADALAAAAGAVGVAAPVESEQTRALVGAGAKGGREKGQGRADERNRQRNANGGRPARGQAPRPVAHPAFSFDRLSGAQQGGLLGLVVLVLIAFIGGFLLFFNNVNVVKADANYKIGQGNDSVAADCLSHAQNPAFFGLCAVGPQFTAQQVAQYAGTQLIPTAIGNYQQAIDQQPNQDMYYLWLGKTYLDEARYYQLIGQPTNAVPWFQKAEDTLKAARALNPYNADHPMNLGRMFAGWAQYDPSKWPLADQYFRIATKLAQNNGRWWDEWGRSDMLQATQRTGTTAAERTALYRQALATFQHACQVDDLLGDARVFRGQAEEKLGQYKQAAASYAEALKVGGFEIFNAPPYPQPAAGAASGTPPPMVVQSLVSALSSAHQYAALVQPAKQLLQPGLRGQGPDYLGESPITLAYSPTLGLTAATSPFSQTLASISTTLRQKGLLK